MGEPYLAEGENEYRVDVIAVEASNPEDTPTKISMLVSELKEIGPKSEGVSETEQLDKASDKNLDFRGNPIPMKDENGEQVVDQDAFKKADVEAYYMWLANFKNDGGAIARQRLQGDIDRMNATLKKKQKDYKAASKPQVQEKLERQIAEDSEYLNTLNAIMARLTPKKEKSQDEILAEELIAKMSERAEPVRHLDYNQENWDKEFPEGRVNTPLGEVKMGENQFTKLAEKKRQGEFGMVKPTLENPDLIIVKYAPEEGAERDQVSICQVVYNR